MSNRSRVLLLIALLVCGISLAQAADPQPYKVVMDSSPDSSLNATLKATSELETLRKTAPVGPFGLIGRARGDLDRLKTVLESFGYYQSYVGVTVDGLPLDDPGLPEELTSRSADNDTEVKITFSLGELYHLRTIQIEGEAPAEARKVLGIDSGAPAVAADVLAAGDRLLNALQDQGYAFAKVDKPIAHEDPPNRVLDITFHVTKGALVQIGAIRIRGLKDMKEPYVRRRLLLHSGEQYSASRIETARKDLLALGVFSSVGVQLGDKPDSEGRVPVAFNVRERKQHAVSIRAAYSSDLGGSTGASWTKRNVSGKADSLTLSADAINLGGTSSNGIGYDVSGKYVIPDWLSRDQSLQTSLGAIRQYLDAYDQTAFTGGVLVTRKLSNIWSISAGFTIEQEHITQHECTPDQCIKQDDTCVELVPPPTKTNPPTYPPCDQRFSYTLFAIPITALYNTTGLSSPLEDATHGLRASFGLTPTLSIGHPNRKFFITQATASLYFDLNNLNLNKTPGRSVLALRALAGLAAGASEFSLPPDQRFYAGGSGTIRGYRYQSVGPAVFPNGNPVGGTAINAGTVEYRQRIGTNFGTAVFIDGGNVSKNLNPLHGELRFGVGAGVRYYTPIGPIRLDLAVPTHRSGANPDAFEIYIGLGQAF